LLRFGTGYGSRWEDARKDGALQDG